MAAKSNFKNMVLCLTLVCLVCSSLLAVVNAVTEEPIQIANENEARASLLKVLPEGGEVSAKLNHEGTEYYTLTENGAVKAYAVKTQAVGFGGPLVLMVGVLADGTVYNTAVLSHSETPGLGAKCTSDTHFMEQFKGFGPDRRLVVKKDGGDVDAITASTITSRAYTLAVSNAVEMVKSLN